MEGQPIDTQARITCSQGTSTDTIRDGADRCDWPCVDRDVRRNGSSGLGLLLRVRLRVSGWLRRQSQRWTSALSHEANTEHFDSSAVVPGGLSPVFLQESESGEPTMTEYKVRRRSLAGPRSS
jgi:hypothetical protein